MSDITIGELRQYYTSIPSNWPIDTHIKDPDLVKEYLNNLNAEGGHMTRTGYWEFNKKDGGVNERIYNHRGNPES